jgi:hypothetical protein
MKVSAGLQTAGIVRGFLFARWLLALSVCTETAKKTGTANK